MIEESFFDDFFVIVEFVGIEFVVEKFNIKFVFVEVRIGLLFFEES